VRPHRAFAATLLGLAATVAGCGGSTPRALPAAVATHRIWVKQVGTDATDVAGAVSVDRSGNVYVAGSTEGGLDGANAGDADAFLAKFDASGRLQWARQLGTPKRDSASAVSADGDAVYIAGLTFGGLDGPNRGEYDAFVAKYDRDGNRLWVKQIGTATGEFASSVSADGRGNVYIAGDTFGSLAGKHVGKADAYLIKYAPDGRRRWARQVGTREGDVARVTAGPGGRVYIAGQTDGSLGGRNAGGSDAFLVAYTSDGRRLWSRQLGTSSLEYANSVTSDRRGAVYIAGIASGSLGRASAGRTDAFVANYDRAGRRLWLQQFGTSGDEQANAAAADNGGVYVVGSTDGRLADRPFGGFDAFVARFNANGKRLWTDVLGTPALDSARAVSTHAGGHAIVVGQTAGTLNASAGRGIDAFIARMRRSPPVNDA